MRKISINSHIWSIFEFKGSDRIIGSLFLVDERHLKRSVHFGQVSSCGPVLSAHHTNEIKYFGQHHNDMGLALPDHSPEIHYSVLIRTLSTDVGIRFYQTLKLDHKLRNPFKTLEDQNLFAIPQTFRNLFQYFIVP